MSVKHVKYPLSLLRALVSLIDLFCPEQPRAQYIEFPITQLKRLQQIVTFEKPGQFSSFPPLISIPTTSLNCSFISSRCGLLGLKVAHFARFMATNNFFVVWFRMFCDGGSIPTTKPEERRNFVHFLTSVSFFIS